MPLISLTNHCTCELCGHQWQVMKPRMPRICCQCCERTDLLFIEASTPTEPEVTFKYDDKERVYKIGSDDLKSLLDEIEAMKEDRAKWRVVDNLAIMINPRRRQIGSAMLMRCVQFLRNPEKANEKESRIFGPLLETTRLANAPSVNNGGPCHGQPLAS